MLFFRKRLKKSTPEEEAALSQRMQEEKVGFKDGFAMVVSAFFMLVLPSLLILVALAGLVMLLFGLL